MFLKSVLRYWHLNFQCYCVLNHLRKGRETTHPGRGVRTLMWGSQDQQMRQLTCSRVLGAQRCLHPWQCGNLKTITRFLASCSANNFWRVKQCTQTHVCGVSFRAPIRKACWGVCFRPCLRWWYKGLTSFGAARFWWNVASNGKLKRFFHCWRYAYLSPCPGSDPHVTPQFALKTQIRLLVNPKHLQKSQIWFVWCYHVLVMGLFHQVR